jgi:hypothetical protein
VAPVYHEIRSLPASPDYSLSALADLIASDAGPSVKILQVLERSFSRERDTDRGRDRVVHRRRIDHAGDGRSQVDGEVAGGGVAYEGTAGVRLRVVCRELAQLRECGIDLRHQRGDGLDSGIGVARHGHRHRRCRLRFELDGDTGDEVGHRVRPSRDGERAGSAPYRELGIVALLDDRRR